MPPEDFASSMIFWSLTSALVPFVAIGLVLFFVLRALRRSNDTKAAARAMSMPVPGTLLVTASAMPSRRALYHMTRINGVISGDGIEPVAVQYAGLIRTSKWPSPGETLPVIVDRADPNRFAIEWDKITDSRTAAISQAEALAAAMRERRDP